MRYLRILLFLLALRWALKRASWTSALTGAGITTTTGAEDQLEA